MRRAWLILPAVLVAVPVAAMVAASTLLSPDAVRTRLQDQVQRATGRELVIAGPVRLAWSLSPRIELHDVGFANPPGFSRPMMAHVEAIEVRIGLLGLLSHRVDIESLLLAAPNILLERNAEGRANWDLSRPAPPVPTGPATPSSANARYALQLGRVDIRDATVAFGKVAVSLPRLGYDGRDGQIRGEVVSSGVPIALGGTAGPITPAAWPLALRFTGGGIDGSLSGTSETAQLAISAPDLESVSSLARWSLPKLHDVSAEATLGAGGLRDLRVQVGASPLGPVILRSATLAMPTWTGPAALTGTALLGALPMAIEGQLGALAALAGGGATPVALVATAQGARLDAQGEVRPGGPVTLAASARADDMARLGAAAGLALPKLHGLRIDATVTLAPMSVTLAGLQAASAEGDLSGSLSVTTAGRPAITGALTADRLDLAAFAPPPKPAPVALPPPSAPTAAPAPEAAGPLIPDARIPYDALRSFDAAVTLAVKQAVWQGRVAHDVGLDLSVQDGRLAVRRSGVGLGDQRLTLDLAADAAARSVAVKLEGAGLPAGPLFALLGGPADATGALDLRADLRGQGDTLRAVLATLTGTAGLALVDGEIDNAWLQSLLAAARLPIEATGRSGVRCAAIAAVAQSGQVTLRALSLDSTRLRLDGEGGASLADETMDLHLSPQLRLGTALSVPVRLRGAFRAPRVSLDAGAIAPGRVGIVLGGAAPPDTCVPALAVARGGAQGLGPAEPPPATKPPRPADLLRSLLR